uniref:PDZ domain-containing protein n=1 Tax=Cyprinus carpio TaxID=7962 RepID=A0A8C1QDV3_CYPCA
MISVSKLPCILFQDMQSDQSEIIVKTVKEVCAEGLVVSGGKDGIFIKEVKPESPASKLLSMKEGDQILSATVYFDNVSYEDALQILEHAQPYKMAFCLKRKPPPRTQEDAEAERPDISIVIIILFIIFLITEYCKVSSEVSLTLQLLHQCLQGEEAEQVEEGMEMTVSVSKPEADLSLPEGKAEIKGFQKKEIKSSEEISFSKPDIDSSLAGHDAEEIPVVAFSKQDIKAAGVDVSLPQVDLSIPEGFVEIKKPGVNVTISKDEAEHKDLTNAGTPVKFKLPSISLPKFGGKSSKVVKDMPFVDIDIEEPDESLPETQISMKLKADAPTGDIKDSFETTEGQFVKSDQAEKDPRSPTKFKRPKIKFPKVGVSFPKSTDAVSDNQMPEVTKDEPTIEIKALETELPTELPSLPEMKTPHIILSVSKPEVDASTIEMEKATDEHSEKKKEKVLSPDYVFSKPEVKMSPAGHDLDQKTAIEDLKVQASNLEAEVNLPSGSVDEVILEAKEKESEFKLKKHKISFPKFGFYKSDTKIPDADTSLQKEGISVPDTVIKETEMTFPAPEVEVQLKNKSTSGSPSKFKLPTISLPKFDISISKTGEESVAKAEDDAQSEIKAASAVSTLETLPVDAEIKTKDTDPSSQGSRFMMPKFEFLFPKVKGPEFKKGASGTDAEKSEHEFSEQVIKAPEINIERGDTSMAVGEVDVNLESDLKIQTTEMLKDDSTMGGSQIKFKLPTFKLPKFRSSSTKEKVEIMDLRGEEITLETEDLITSVEPLDVKIDSNVPIDLKDTGMKMKRPGFSLPKFGFSKPDIKAPEIDVKQIMNITVSNVEDDQKDIGATAKFQLPSINIPKIGGQAMKEEKTIPIVDIAIKGPEVTGSDTQIKISGEAPSVDMKGPHLATEGQSVSVDLNVEDAELGEQGGKFKMPKFGIGLPKVKGFDLNITVADSELEGTHIKTDISKPDVKSEVQPPKTEAEVEGGVDMPEVDSKELQVKVKRPSFSFPKFGFSKPDTATPEVNISIPKAEVSIPEVNVPVKEQTAQVTLPGGEAEQKDITIVSSPTKFKLPEVNLSKFGVKTSKGTVSLPSADKDMKVSCQIQKADLDVKEIETDIHATKGETDVHLAEGKVILPKPDVDVQDISIEGKADMPEVDLKGHAVKLKKPSFSLPKFGFSKTEIKGQDVDASQLKADMYMQEHNIPVVDKDAEITITEEVKLQGDTTTQTKFKMPSINLPKFGLKYPKATVDIPAAEVDVKEPEISFPEKGEVQTTDTETNIDIKGPSVDVDIKVKGIDHDDGMGSKFKLPKFGIGMPKVKEIEMEGKEINIETGLLCEENVNVQQPGVEIQNVTIEGKTDKADVDSKGLKVKLPKLGFSKPDLKAPEVDVSLPKADMGAQFGSP